MTHGGMRALGAPAGPAPTGPLGPDDGTDDGAAAGGHENECDRYNRADKAGKGLLLDELCATTGWHRNHARKSLAQALKPRLVRPRAPRVPIYGPDVIAALAFCWAVLGAPTGKRLAPIMSELVPTLRRFDQLVISDDTEMALLAMSPATMDRRLAADRAKLVRGRPHTKRGRC